MPVLDERLVVRLHAAAEAGRWSLPVDGFRAALEASAARAFPPGAAAAARDVERYLSGLHLADLALAAACAGGDAAAWDHFVREYRPVLYRSAAALDATGGAREIADSLYADLYGLQERDGQRRSLLRYFHGRSSLATWLRSVLAQRHVDAVRARRRIEPLPDDESAIAAPAPAPRDPDAPRYHAALQRALVAAVDRLPARERLRLSCYYGQGLTLAETGRILREHEATVSRQVARSRRTVREDVERALRAGGFGDAEVARCFEVALEDAGPIDLGRVFSSAAGRKDLDPDRSE